MTHAATRRALACLLALVAVLAVPVSAAAACPRTSLPDVEDEVMCPVCGTPLNTADAPQATQQRNFIRREIARCATKDEIKVRLVSQYGESVLALPEDEGFGRAAYLVPLGALGLALAGVLLALRRWRRVRPASGAGPDPDGGLREDRTVGEPAPIPAPTPTPGEQRRLDDDLARYDL